jgi:hypothetical protein
VIFESLLKSCPFKIADLFRGFVRKRDWDGNIEVAGGGGDTHLRGVEETGA